MAYERAAANAGEKLDVMAWGEENTEDRDSAQGAL
jgi:hypothetical protein